MDAPEPKLEEKVETQKSGSGEDLGRPDKSRNIDQILKMNVPVIVKVAQKRALLKDVLKWNLGSLLLFEKDAYELIDLMVNNSTIGRGQPVKIGEKFGIKIIQISDIKDTILSLGEHPQDHL